ncbi:MAG TPA: type I pantothenate kinase [Acidimicrobiales bacterium]|nr:type I pantothenate kinase [Acidimicrobiales bacterium]
MAAARYLDLDRDTWSALRASTPLTLGEAELDEIRGLNEHLSIDEVVDVYLPVSRLLNLHVAASQELHGVTQRFLASGEAKVPYVIGIAGSVAVGKSTTARLLQALLARWPDHPRVDLVTTDGFLHPIAVLEARGIMHRKGFPESYDRRRLIDVLVALKSGAPEVRVPIYSHLVYDVVEGEEQVIHQPDVVIVEGLNVLQRGGPDDELVVSDLFDFSVYVDADEDDIRSWFLERFLTLRATAFVDPTSFFHRYAEMPEPDAIAFANGIWDGINGVNLVENILPTRDRAHLILDKGPDHRVRSVRLRKL